MSKKCKYRDVAQMVARHVRDVDAAGSTPVISTTAEKVPFRVPFLLCIENEESNLMEVCASRKRYSISFLAQRREAFMPSV